MLKLTRSCQNAGCDWVLATIRHHSGLGCHRRGMLRSALEREWSSWMCMRTLADGENITPGSSWFAMVGTVVLSDGDVVMEKSIY